MSKRYLADQFPRFFGELWQLAGDARGYARYLEEHFDVLEDDEMGKLHLQMVELADRLNNASLCAGRICVPTGDEE